MTASSGRSGGSRGRATLEDLLAEAFVKIHGGSKDHKRIKDLVREASHNLRSRGQRVEDMVKGFNDRNGVELPKPPDTGGCRGPARRGRALLALALRIELRMA